MDTRYVIRFWGRLSSDANRTDQPFVSLGWIKGDDPLFLSRMTRMLPRATFRGYEVHIDFIYAEMQ